MYVRQVPLQEASSQFRCEFPVENRLIKQSETFVEALLKQQPGANLATLLQDFHLLLFLSNVFGDAVCRTLQSLLFPRVY